MNAARPLTMADWPQEFRDPRPITRRISKARAARRLVENVGELARRGYPVRESLAAYEHRVNHAAWLRRKSAASLAGVLAKIREEPTPASGWAPYKPLTRRQRDARLKAEVRSENQLEARKVTLSPEPHRQGRYPILWAPRGLPTHPRCECEASFGGRQLHRWLAERDERACLVTDVGHGGDPALTDWTHAWDCVERSVPIDPGAPSWDVSFEETCQAFSALDRCRAPVHFPNSIDEAAFGRTTTTVRGMQGRSFEVMDSGKVRESLRWIDVTDREYSAEVAGSLVDDGMIPHRNVVRFMPGPFEAMSARNWEWAEFVGMTSTLVAVHEGIDTEYGYRANPRWTASADRIEREYAPGPQRRDLNAPLDLDNMLFDQDGRVMLSLTNYEYLRRQIESRKGRPDGKRFTGFACGTYVPEKLWWHLFDRHVAKEKMEREKRKIAALMTSLRFDPLDERVQARIAALDATGRDEAIRKLYRMHRERGLVVPR